MNIIDLLSWALLIIGCFLCISGALGLLRFPDFFTRMHAASVTDTLGSGLLLLGLALQSNGEWLVISKLVFIFLFLLITSPTASHALAKSAIHGGLTPWTKDNTGKKPQGEQSSNS
jgi:multicomponent Na+:H+ antiporter subunit G